MLGDRATLLDAAKYYIANHRGNGPQPEATRFDEAAKLYHAFKVADGKSASHFGNIESRLKRLTNQRRRWRFRLARSSADSTSWGT